METQIIDRIAIQCICSYVCYIYSTHRLFAWRSCSRDYMYYKAKNSSCLLWHTQAKFAQPAERQSDG